MSDIVKFAKWVLEMEEKKLISEDTELWLDVYDEIELSEAAYIDEEGDIILSNKLDEIETKNYLIFKTQL